MLVLINVILQVARRGAPSYSTAFESVGRFDVDLPLMASCVFSFSVFCPRTQRPGS